MSSCWGNGFAVIAELTYESAAYVARYVNKKLYGDKAELYSRLGILPERSFMSRVPGIGKLWYDRNKDHIYDYDQVEVIRKGVVKAIKPPGYFDRLYMLENPERMREIKDVRKECADFSLSASLAQTCLSLNEYNELRESVQLDKIKKLTRPIL